MSQPGQVLPGKCPNGRMPASFPVSRRAILLAGVVLVLAVLAAYWNSFSVPFLFDDAKSIGDNPTIQHLWPLGRVLQPPKGGLTVSGRPVVNLSLAVNHALGGMKVWGYHALNLSVHALAALTLFGIVRRTLLKPVLGERFGTSALPLALVAGLLWALHPLQTETVIYVVQRAESLMGLFYLLTLYGFIRGTESGWAGWYGLSIGACVVGMGSKEVMVTAPLMVWVYDRTFVAGTFMGALRKRWRVYVGLGMSWLLLGYLVIQSGELVSPRAGFHATVGWWAYGLTQMWAIGHYLKLAVWPRGLVFDYGAPLVTEAWQVAPGGLVVMMLAGGAVVSLWRWPVLGFVGSWFFGILAPTSSVLPLAGQTVAEHRMYLPLAAVVVLVVVAMYELAGRRSLVVLTAVGMVFGFVTSRRAEDYSSALRIWSDTVAKRPDNGRAQNNLGGVLLQNGQVDEAIARFQKSLETLPDYVDAHNNLGYALLRTGREDEAVARFQKALEIQPDFAEARNNLGKALLQAGRMDEAIAHFQKAVETRPNYAEAHCNLGVALVQKGRLDEAIAQYKKALETQPDSAIVHYNLGGALVQKGRVEEAIAQYLSALEINPGLAEVHNNLGTIYLNTGHVEEAFAQFLKALEIRPDFAEACNNLTSLLATSPKSSIRNGAKAVELAEQANRLSGGSNTAILGTLAAAYSEVERFAEAVSTAQQAAELATAQGNTSLASTLQRQIRLYQAGSPFHGNLPDAR